MNRIKLLHPGSDLLVFSLCAVLSVALCGCSLFVEEPAPVEEQQAELEVIPEEPIPTPDPRPRLAVARNDQISLFGELPDNPEVPYFTRTATSLLQHTFAGEGADFDTYISPDGKWMIFASTRHNKNPDIYYKAVQGVAVTQLTSDPAADVQPIYSPDRTKVAFAQQPNGQLGHLDHRPRRTTPGANHLQLGTRCAPELVSRWNEARLLQSANKRSMGALGCRCFNWWQEAVHRLWAFPRMVTCGQHNRLPTSARTRQPLVQHLDARTGRR